MKGGPCIGCDGEAKATGPDGWCDDCRRMAEADEIPAAHPDFVRQEQLDITARRRREARQ